MNYYVKTIIKSGDSDEQWKIDALTKAGHITRYSQLSTDILSLPAYSTTYYYRYSGTAGDVFNQTPLMCLRGSSTKTVLITRVFFVFESSTASGLATVHLRRYADPTTSEVIGSRKVPHDSSSSPGTAALCGAPSSDSVGDVWAGIVEVNLTTLAAINSTPITTTVDFISLYGKPIVLRGESEQLAICLTYTTIDANSFAHLGYVWAEF